MNHMHVEKELSIQGGVSFLQWDVEDVDPVYN